MRNALRLWLLTLTFAAAAAAAAPPTVEDAWARATPPAAKTGAVYLTLTADGADRLLGADSPAAREVQIHTHVNEAGMSRMVQLPELALPAGAGVRLEPGGLHLMLIDLARPLVAGESIELRLTLANAGPLELTVPVRDARAAGPSPAADAHGAHGAHGAP
jgi:copper(I)-binding protein